MALRSTMLRFFVSRPSTEKDSFPSCGWKMTGERAPMRTRSQKDTPKIRTHGAKANRKGGRGERKITVKIEENGVKRQRCVHVGKIHTRSSTLEKRRATPATTDEEGHHHRNPNIEYL
eukprot:scaffold1123_cov168-Amphora_coffeaeformis.AAC.38